MLAFLLAACSHAAHARSDAPNTAIARTIRVWVTGASVEDAQHNGLGRALPTYANLASSQGKWGFRISSDWRRASPDQIGALINVPGKLVESFAGNCYIINVTFLDRPAATRNGNVYSAADVLARAAESAEAQEPVELRTELTQPTQK
jgi:hypothetical protein